MSLAELDMRARLYFPEVARKTTKHVNQRLLRKKQAQKR